MTIFFFNTSIFLIYCFIWICLTNNNFLLQAAVHGRESSLMELFVETDVWNDDRRKMVQHLVDSWAQHFVVCWISKISFFYVIIFLNLLTFFSIHITPDWRRDIKTIIWPIQNSIWISGWRKDCLVDLIEIGCTVSQTIWPKTCRWPRVFLLLEAHN